MTLSEYIKSLQSIEEEHGGKPICITQAGYYAEGQFADIWDVPDIVEINDYYEDVDPDDWSKRERVYHKKVFVVLGHSSQNY